MPPIEEYQKYIEGIWDREYLTNNGPLVQKLEEQLGEFLGLDNVLFLSNGTIALQIAIKALALKGEIITTPFSFVATTSSIVWEGCEPVFVDINPDTLNINPELIEEAVTEHTTGILATHVYGNPCDIEAIEAIAKKHDLKVIYDAAHCFGTTYKNKSIFEYGDISITSFHATKLFHTVEGGAIFTEDDELNLKMSRMRNFGHAGFENFEEIGINGKNSEFHAAMGLTNLNYIHAILDKRKEQCLLYNKLFTESPLRTITMQKGAEWNYAYYPIILENEETALKVKQALEKQDIYPRRYFYPSLDTLEYVQTTELNVSKKVAESILCLPLFYDLKKESQQLIADIIKRVI